MKLDGSTVGEGDDNNTSDDAVGGLELSDDRKTPNFLRSAFTCCNCRAENFFFFFDFDLLLLLEDMMHIS